MCIESVKFFEDYVTRFFIGFHPNPTSDLLEFPSFHLSPDFLSLFCSKKNPMKLFSNKPPFGITF